MTAPDAEIAALAVSLSFETRADLVSVIDGREPRAFTDSLVRALWGETAPLYGAAVRMSAADRRRVTHELTAARDLLAEDPFDGERANSAALLAALVDLLTVAELEAATAAAAPPEHPEHTQNPDGEGSGGALGPVADLPPGLSADG